LGHKKHKKRFYTQKNPSSQYQPVVIHRHKKMMPGGMKTLLAILSIALIGGVAYWGFSSQGPTSPQTAQQVYPQTAAGKFYSGAILSSDQTKAYVPTAVIQINKLTFVDLTLESPTNEITYQGLTIPLSLYNSGKYLPMLVISTPSGKVIAGVRVCEPCGSFSFHIAQGTNLKCDVCGAEWDLETFAGVSGGCQSYPPPKLPSSVASNVAIDLSPLGIRMAL